MLHYMDDWDYVCPWLLWSITWFSDTFQTVVNLWHMCQCLHWWGWQTLVARWHFLIGLTSALAAKWNPACQKTSLHKVMLNVVRKYWLFVLAEKNLFRSRRILPWVQHCFKADFFLENINNISMDPMSHNNQRTWSDSIIDWFTSVSSHLAKYYSMLNFEIKSAPCI